MTFIQNISVLNKLLQSKIGFRAAPQANLIMPDSVFMNGDSYTNSNFVYSRLNVEVLKSNPRIKEILGRYNLPFTVNVSELNKLQKGHLAKTRLIAAQIYSELPWNKQQEVNLSVLQQAAMFHDIGKILIPDKILNKKEALTDEEKEIINLHSELGAEILRSMGINEEVCRLVKYHHQNALGTGYPEKGSDYPNNTELEILRIADEYDALTENRSYRKAMSNKEALAIVHKDTDQITPNYVTSAFSNTVRKFYSNNIT